MDIQTWFNSVPKFTKCYLTFAFGEYTTAVKYHKNL